MYIFIQASILIKTILVSFSTAFEFGINLEHKHARPLLKLSTLKASAWILLPNYAQTIISRCELVLNVKNY